MKQLYHTKSKIQNKMVIMMPLGVESIIAVQVRTRMDCIKKPLRSLKESILALMRGIYYSIRWIK